MQQNQVKKSILLAMPQDYQLANLIEQNLTYLNFNVIRIYPFIKDNTFKKFKYRSLKDRVLNFIHKTFLINKEYKKKILNKYEFQDLCKPIADHKIKIDYGIFIRADFFDDDLIKYSKKRTKFLISYHYDGLNRSKTIFDKIKYFDKFYVFNKPDLEFNKYSLLPATNFYFDFEEKNNNQAPKYKFYFLGSHHQSRYKMLIQLKQYLSNISNSVLFEIVFCQEDFDKIKQYTSAEIHCSKSIIDYENYLKKIKETEVIIDLLIDEHKGLSFRVFESIKYGKKLITNNTSIKKYNFYNKNNILIINESNLNEIEEFLKLPYIKIPNEIYYQYSFTNWLNYILQNEPYQNLNIY